MREPEGVLGVGSSAVLGGKIVIPLNQCYKIWLNPDVMESLGLQLNMSVTIKSSNRVTTTNHVLEKILRPHVIHNARRILGRSVSNDSNLVSNLELSFCHAREAA